MTQTAEQVIGDWTAADLVRRFGPIPLRRIRLEPVPGSATEEDVLAVHAREDRLCELVDGVLVEKTMGWYESYLTVVLISVLVDFVKNNGLGIVLGADGMVRLAPGLLRIPDVSFISWARVPTADARNEAIFPLAPDLAVEVISKGNTREEMEQKLTDYFAAGVREAWYVYPEQRQIRVYSSADRCRVFGGQQVLEGSQVLPEFRLGLSEFFAPPAQPPSP
jgi:Uma2 family endonuclease